MLAVETPTKKKPKMKVSARFQQVENGYIVTVEYQKADRWEDKQYVAKTEAEAKQIINNAFKAMKTK